MPILNQVYVAAKPAKIKSVEGILNVLSDYESHAEFGVVADGENSQGLLKLHKDDEFREWPSAVRFDELPDEDDFENEDLWRDAVYDEHDKKGEEAFTQMLLDLAPHLESPLIVQAASFSSSGEFGSAKEWTVRPGATEVEIREIAAFDEE